MCGGIDDGFSNGEYNIGDIINTSSHTYDGANFICIGQDDHHLMLAESVIREKKGHIIICGNSGRGKSLYEAEFLQVAIKLEFILKAAAIPYTLYDEYPSLERSIKRTKPMKKCLLPSCQKTTNHNKGFCSVECYKFYKRITKKTRLS